ncbi:hypothetical protein P170DRAFT_433536 [Aspergillus steynii IBT 23096]|uniref:LipA and NB-ARC domain protein n=1 Tax=Aspergillus steynii IBT 23096 TaxID=1392250 RepID=A0A2I2GFK3_9EURO|nr:uncharacterized protein P170DRAFT_433536 [Aspergillus steynii IBT 23096]PLB51659.1 hypothetical protein P170DRAFT_433536 [Aspergillus steynii IBT 23096]
MPSDIRRKPIPAAVPYDDLGVTRGVTSVPTPPPNYHLHASPAPSARTLHRYPSQPDFRAPSPARNLPPSLMPARPNQAPPRYPSNSDIYAPNERNLRPPLTPSDSSQTLPRYPSPDLRSPSPSYTSYRPSTSSGPSQPPPQYPTEPVLRSSKSSNNLRPPLTSTVSAQTLPRYPSNPDLLTPNPSNPPPRAATDVLPTTTPPPPAPSASSEPSAVQKAYGEARHFLGGLIAHPTESTKHYTILRHSHGVVFYRGSTTSVTLSIFSDAPLPADRTLWLQSKGWSGKTGMRTKALLRLNDDWINVTPSLALHADQVPPADERAWQRDIEKFRRKNTSNKTRAHVLRETVVARIPADAGDGYFQLVLCGPKKKVLCGSPVFRVLSTSLSPSSVRGASLSTLPLEMGAMVLGLYAQATANRVIGPAAAVVQSKVDRYSPSTVKKFAAEKAITVSGVGNHVAGMIKAAPETTAYGQGQGQGQFQTTESLDLGPQPPFPMDFKARGTPSQAVAESDDLRFTLAKVPDSITDQLHGVFFGWARFLDANPQSQRPQYWIQAIISVASMDPSLQTRVNMSQTMRRTVSLRLLDADDASLPPSPLPQTYPHPQSSPQPPIWDEKQPLPPPSPQQPKPTASPAPVPTQCKLQIRIMGFLRPTLPPPTASTERDLLVAREQAAETALLADACDATYAQSALDHPAWGAEQVGAKGAGEGANGTWMEKTREGYQSALSRGQRMVENVPLHWIGVRSTAAEIRDRQVGASGFFIVR